MKHLAPHSREELLVTRDPARHQRARAARFIGTPHLREQVLANSHAEFVVLALVAEAAGHAAALDRRSHDIEARGAQHFDGLRSGVASPLLAMRVIEQPRPVWTAAGGK